jgi:16S rRNA (guanine527-N7)-methyltransferase
MFDKYRELLVTWNRSIRLVGSGDDFDRHVAESRTVLPHLPDAGRIIDVGAGAGFPSVVIAIERPALHVVALEPVHKKHAFLAAVRREIGLANFVPLAERDDEHAFPTPYDAALSRATFALAEWLDRGRRLVRPGGTVIGMEGRNRAELPAHAVRYPAAVGDRDLSIVVVRVPSSDTR